MSMYDKDGVFLQRKSLRCLWKNAEANTISDLENPVGLFFVLFHGHKIVIE